MKSSLEHPNLRELAPREREVMDSLLALGGGSVQEVRAQLTKPPAYDTVRSILRALERKGYVIHNRDGRRFVYVPALSRQQARRQALERVVGTLFDGSVPAASLALLGLMEDDPGEELVQELRRLIEVADEARRKATDRPGER